MDRLMDFLKEFNLQTIISLAVICWYFTRDIKKDIEKNNEEFHKMNTRISRVEGTLYGKDIYEKIDE